MTSLISERLRRLRSGAQLPPVYRRQQRPGPLGRARKSSCCCTTLF